MKKLPVVVVLSLLAVPSLAFGQAPTPQPPQPGPEVQKLAYFLGTWKAEGEPDPSGVQAAPIARDGIVLIVHPSNRTPGLTLLQLRALYRGETLDWAEALIALDRVALDPQAVADTLGVLLKYQDDVGALSPEVAAKIVADVQAEGIRL